MLSLLIAAAVAAAPAPAPTADTTRAPARVCHKIAYLGSRLNAATICKTRQEWNDLQADHDHMLRQQQQLDRALNDNN